MGLRRVIQGFGPLKYGLFDGQDQCDSRFDNYLRADVTRIVDAAVVLPGLGREN
jgi:hypothetical protein